MGRHGLRRPGQLTRAGAGTAWRVRPSPPYVAYVPRTSTLTLVDHPVPRMFVLACLATLALSSCDRFRGPKTAFDGAAAYAMVKTQVDFGPRVPGSPGWQKTGDWIVAQLKQLGDSVTEQRFMHVTPKGDTVPMRNIIGHIAPDKSQRVLYVTHWDTRSIAENEPVLGNRDKPIPGANDGASGVALLLQVAAFSKATSGTSWAGRVAVAGLLKVVATPIMNNKT